MWKPQITLRLGNYPLFLFSTQHANFVNSIQYEKWFLSRAMQISYGLGAVSANFFQKKASKCRCVIATKRTCQHIDSET